MNELIKKMDEEDPSTRTNENNKNENNVTGRQTKEKSLKRKRGKAVNADKENGTDSDSILYVHYCMS
jgi:hypothetical protein